MAQDAGPFRTDIELENVEHEGERCRVRALLVDASSPLSWIPAHVLEAIGAPRVKLLRFRKATGEIIERWTGAARLYAAGTHTFDEFVVAEPNDVALIGARTLSGLNVVVDPVNRRLVDAGAMPAAAA